MLDKILDYLKSSHDFYDKRWSDAVSDDDRQFYMGATVAYGAAQHHVLELLRETREAEDVRLS